MREQTSQYMLRRIRQLAACVDDGIITEMEMVRALLDLFSATEHADPLIVLELLAIVPEKVQDRFKVAIRGVLNPCYSRHGLRRGGGPIMTEEELRADAQIRTCNVRRWAELIVPLLPST